MDTAKELIGRIELHCRARRIAESTFGRLSVNDGKLVARLRAGKSITLDTLRRIEAALSTAASNPSEGPGDREADRDHREDDEGALDPPLDGTTHQPEPAA
ncbi:MAG: hypothetical protein VW405_01315 [Rhodospirillaceae bacterium]